MKQSCGLFHPGNPRRGYRHRSAAGGGKSEARMAKRLKFARAESSANFGFRKRTSREDTLCHLGLLYSFSPAGEITPYPTASSI